MFYKLFHNFAAAPLSRAEDLDENEKQDGQGNEITPVNDTAESPKELTVRKTTQFGHIINVLNTNTNQS